MRLSELKNKLDTLEAIAFQLPDGQLVPSHFHVTEVGKITKNFIDCGGTVRNEEVISLQLWKAGDYDHRLHPDKLLEIVTLSERILELGDLEIEVEYQAETIAKFGLDFDGTKFLLTTTQTDCLAKEKCGIPEEKPKVKLQDLHKKRVCSPGGNCC